MTSAHILFIPAVLALGIVLGFIFGSRVARDEKLLQERREEERRVARAARAARKKARAEGVEPEFEPTLDS